MRSDVTRFYSVVDVEAASGSFVVTLDGKAIRTPKQRTLLMPSRALADAVADEWAAQEKKVSLVAMPFTRLIANAIDLMPACREQIIDEIVAYVGTDLVCYRAEHPFELAKRQESAWKPLLDGFERYFHVGLYATKGMQPIAQDPKAMVSVRRELASENDMRLIGLHRSTTILGSVVIALAISRGEIDVDAAWKASIVDESFQNERWGCDDDEKRRSKADYADLRAAVKFMQLIRLKYRESANI